MAIYIPMIFFSVIFVWLVKHVREKQKIWMLTLAIIIPTIIAALRYDNGADYLMYLRMMKTYESMGNTLASFKSVKLIEVGFYVLLKLCGFLWPGKYFLTYGVIALIICGFTYAALWKQSKNIVLSVFLFFASGIYFDSFNALRQFLAIAIVFYGFQYIWKGEFKKYCIAVCTGALFHYSAIIMIPVYFIRNFNVGIKRACLIAGGCVVGSNAIYNVISYVLQYSRYTYFLSSLEYQVVPTYSTILSTSILTVVSYTYIEIKKVNVSYRFRQMMNMQLLVWISALISLAVPLALRLQEYFMIFVILYIPCFLVEVKNKYDRLIMGGVFIVLYVAMNIWGMVYNGWYTAIPYQYYFDYIFS